MSHFLTVPLNANGIIMDGNIDAEIAMAAIKPFRFTDVFIYSHGWWNTATDAMSEYNVFSVGFSHILQTLILQDPNPLPRVTANFSALSIGIHWPAMLSEDQDSMENFAEASSFFTMESRADDVGKRGIYALLRLIIEARRGQPPLRFHLIGHSFGCRVLCSALQQLVNDSATLSLAANEQAEFNLVLLQAATDCDSLAPNKQYGDVLTKIKGIRTLITTSQRDTALNTWYPTAHRLAHLFTDPTPAMGAAGPRGLDPACFTPFVVSGAFPSLKGPLYVADLTPVHDAHKAAWGNSGGWGGQHSDINLPDIYELIARFLGN